MAERQRNLARVLRVFVLACLVAVSPGAHAQDRRTNADRGGSVALCSTPFAWSADECAAFLGERAGTRLLLVIGDALDPLAAARQPGERATLDLEHGDPGDDLALVQRIEHAAAIELAGGTWLEWWPVLYHGSKSTRLAQALREAHRRGTPVLATSGAASHLAQACLVPRSVLGKPRRNARTPDPDAQVNGLGLAAVVWEPASDPGATLDAMLRALLRRPLDGAVYAHGAAALVIGADGVSARVLARDGGALLFVDISRARRMRESLREGRVALGEHGSRWDLALRAPSGAWSAFAGTRGPAAPRREVRDALAPAVWLERLRASAWTDASECTLASADCEVRFALTPDSLRADLEPRPLAHVSFDVQWAFPDPASAEPERARDEPVTPPR